MSYLLTAPEIESDTIGSIFAIFDECAKKNKIQSIDFSPSSDFKTKPGLPNLMYVFIKCLDKCIYTSLEPYIKLFEMGPAAKSIVEEWPILVAEAAAIPAPANVDAIKKAADFLVTKLAELAKPAKDLISLFDEITQPTPIITYAINKLTEPVSQNIAIPINIKALGIPISFKPELAKSESDFIANTILKFEESISQIITLPTNPTNNILDVNSLLLEMQKQLVSFPLIIIKFFTKLILLPVDICVGILKGTIDIIKDLLTPSPATAQKILDLIATITANPLEYFSKIINEILQPVVKTALNSLIPDIEPTDTFNPAQGIINLTNLILCSCSKLVNLIIKVFLKLIGLG
jgi:hypothetical protein